MAVRVNYQGENKAYYQNEIHIYATVSAGLVGFEFTVVDGQQSYNFVRSAFTLG